MGRSDQAYKLAAEALAASWPLADGTLLAPRILSNISDAPYLGEAATLFAFTRRPLAPMQGASRAKPPAMVHVVLAALLLIGAGEIAASVLKLRRRRRDDRRYVPLPQVQVLVWGVLLVGAAAVWLRFSAVAGLVLLLAALVLPWQRKRPHVEDAPVAAESLSH